MKKILILTAGYGEGHNAAARGIRDGLARVAPDAVVDVRDLFAENFGVFHKLVRRGYLTLINRWPWAWRYVYDWLDNKTDFTKDFRKFRRLTERLARRLERFEPDVVVSTFMAYAHLLNQASGENGGYKNVVVVTDSITVNAIWYRCRADYFLLPNEQSAAVLLNAGVAWERVKTFGFPVSPKFADLAHDRQLHLERKPKVLYMITAGKSNAPALAKKLLQLGVDLTVTVGRDNKLLRQIQRAARNQKIEIIGWTDEMPRLLSENHLLIGKAGGASVQETIAARCPMIINHVVSGQEEGNAQLIVQSSCGAIATSNDAVVTQVQRAFGDYGKQWNEWQANISQLSRPRASLDIAEFLLSI